MPIVPPASPLDRLSAPAPPGRFLSNGSYTVLVTSAGTGFSTAGACRLNVWDGDRITDGDGFFFYLRDVESGLTWSAGDQPVRHPAARYECRWTPGAFEIERSDDGISTRTEIAVPSSDPVELRRVSLTNRGDRARRIELTSYLEVLLGDPASHAAHPVFSKLFVQTAFVPDRQALLATRRPRARGESHPCLFHALLEEGDLQHETDRARFLGRLRSKGAPLALQGDAALSGTTGNVLDPILSLRRLVSLAPGETATSTFALGVAADRHSALDLIRRVVAEDPAVDRFDSAKGRSRRALHALGSSEPAAEYAQDLAAAILYGHPALRCAPAAIERAAGVEGDLERFGVSWRRPFAVFHAGRSGGGDLLPALLEIHRYWRSLGLRIDLLIICADPIRAREGAGDLLDDAVRFARGIDLSSSTRDRIDAAARLVVNDRLPSLASAAVTARSDS